MRRQLRRFLGFVGYYSKFIPNFASVASPLTECLKKNQPNRLQWGPPQMQAFEWLRRSLSGELVLQYPDFDLPFVLHTDASGTGLGTVLSQCKDGKE